MGHRVEQFFYISYAIVKVYDLSIILKTWLQNSSITYLKVGI